MAKLRLPGDSLWYIVAEALFRSELAGLPPIAQFESVAPLRHLSINESDFAPAAGSRPKKADVEKLAKRRSETISANYLSRFGECVVRANPVLTFKLLSSAIRSAEENAAFDGLSPTFKSCLLDDRTAVLNRFSVRGTLAYNYYRLAHARGNAAKQPGATN